MSLAQRTDLIVALTFSALRGGDTAEEAYAYLKDWDVEAAPVKEERAAPVPPQAQPKNRTQRRREQRRRAKGRK